MMATGFVQPRKGVTPYQQPEGGPRFLSDMIIELGLADEQHVNQAVDTARSSGATVGQILIQEGVLSEDDLARALAARYGLAHIDLDEFEVDPDAANLLPPAAARRYKAVPLAFEADGTLLVAMADPSDSLALSDIAFMSHLEVQATVAAANLISELVARLPLPPSEHGSHFPVPPAAPAPESVPAVPAAEPQGFAPASAAPPVDTSELDRLRAELDQANAEIEQAAAVLDSERSKHAQMIAELRHQPSDEGAQAELTAARAELEALRADSERSRSELEVARSERDAARAELGIARTERDSARGERESSRGELDAMRSERDSLRGELEGVRGERDTMQGELEGIQRELEGARGELDGARGELEGVRGELEGVRGELEGARAEAQANAEASQRAAEASQRAAEAERRAAELEQRLDELGDAEQRVAEAHSMVEKMRNEFELEREGYAATERDLRARLASETERHEALKDAHAALQKRVEVLRTQNAALLDAYATAKRWSAEFARGARELTATLEQPVLDDAVRAQQNGEDTAGGRDSGRFAREDEEDNPDGDATPPPDWLK